MVNSRACDVEIFVPHREQAGAGEVEAVVVLGLALAVDDAMRELVPRATALFLLGLEVVEIHRRIHAQSVELVEVRREQRKRVQIDQVPGGESRVSQGRVKGESRASQG